MPTLTLLDLPDDLLDLVLNHPARLTNREQACAACACRRLRRAVAFRHVVLVHTRIQAQVPMRSRLAAALRGGACETLNVGVGWATRVSETRLEILNLVAADFPERVLRLRRARVEWLFPRACGGRCLTASFPSLETVEVANDLDNPPLVFDPRVVFLNVCAVSDQANHTGVLMRMARMPRPPVRLQLRFYADLRDVESARDAGLRVSYVIVSQNNDHPALMSAAAALATDQVSCLFDTDGANSLTVARHFRVETVRKLCVCGHAPGFFDTLDARYPPSRAYAPIALILSNPPPNVEGLLRLASRGVIGSLCLPTGNLSLDVWMRLLADAPALDSIIVGVITLEDATALFSVRTPSTLRCVRLGLLGSQGLLGALGARLAELRGLRTVALTFPTTDSMAENVANMREAYMDKMRYVDFVEALTTCPPPYLEGVSTPRSVNWTKKGGLSIL